ILSLAVVTLVTRFETGQSRSAYIIFGALLMLTMVSLRLSFRVLEALADQQNVMPRGSVQVPVLIYGAGRGGKLVLDEIRSHPALGKFTPLGFVDDDPLMDGHSLCGLPVRLPSRWAEQVLCTPLEIWVSSCTIPHARVSQLAERWNGKVDLRRARVVLEPSPDSEESPTVSKKSSNLTLIPSLERIPMSASRHAPEAR
ncbi:MAG: nucleoside-diphosphate sugar epimerase/dehydratase, partial [Nitrospiraceae bacterium]